MTQPRCILAGGVWMITRRITRRHYVLRPDKDGTSQRLYWYITAVIAAKYGIQLHAVQVLSTHIHEILTDVRGILPAFLRERNRLLANALKCHRGWPEEVFQRAPASCVALYGAAAVIKQIGYTLANCVEAGLVDHPSQWPGVTVQVADLAGRVVEVERPNIYFDPDNPIWPARARIAIQMPAILDVVHGRRAMDVLRKAVDEAIKRARESARKAGRIVKRPISRLFTVPIMRRSSSFEPFGERNPTFATGGDPHWAALARSERREFLQGYRAALDGARRGLQSVPFPRGTWRWTREVFTGLLRAKSPDAVPFGAG